MRRFDLSLVLFALLLAAALPAAAESLHPVGGALWTVSPAAPWDLGLRARFDQRQFKTGGETLEVSQNHYLVHLGFRPIEPLNLWGEAGAAEAESDDGRGESGFEWALGGRLRLVEFVLTSNDILPRKERVALELGASLRSVTSNLTEADFNYTEFRAEPTVVYALSRADTQRWRPYEPVEVGIRGGLVFLTADGDYGSASLEENHNYGGLLGFDALFDDGWSVHGSAVFFGGSEHEYGVGLSRNF